MIIEVSDLIAVLEELRKSVFVRRKSGGQPALGSCLPGVNTMTSRSRENTTCAPSFDYNRRLLCMLLRLDKCQRCYPFHESHDFMHTPPSMSSSNKTCKHHSRITTPQLPSCYPKRPDSAILFIQNTNVCEQYANTLNSRLSHTTAAADAKMRT